MNRELKNPGTLRELNRRRKPSPERAMTHMGPTAMEHPLVAGRRVAQVAAGVVEVAVASMADVEFSCPGTETKAFRAFVPLKAVSGHGIGQGSAAGAKVTARTHQTKLSRSGSWKLQTLLL